MRKKMNKYLVRFNNIFSILVFFGLFIFFSCNRTSVAPKDCFGIEGGSATLDQCGVCDGDGSSCSDGANEGNDSAGDNMECDDGYIWNSGISSQLCTPQQFLYNTSIEQAAYFFMNVTFNGQLLEENDWVGAFNGNTCVGARKWDTSQCGGGICEVPVLGIGNEPESGYMSIGQIPTFKIFDASSQTYYEACPSEQNSWYNLATYIIDSLSEDSDNNSNCTSLVNK